MNFNKIIVFLAFFSAFIGAHNVFSMNSAGPSTAPRAPRPAPLLTPPNSPLVTPTNSPTAVRKRVAQNLVTPINPGSCGIIASPAAQDNSPIVRTGKIPVHGMSSTELSRATTTSRGKIKDNQKWQKNDFEKKIFNESINDLGETARSDKNYDVVIIANSCEYIYKFICLTSQDEYPFRLYSTQYAKDIETVVTALRQLVSSCKLKSDAEVLRKWLLKFEQLISINTEHIYRLFFYQDNQGTTRIGGGHLFNENQQNESDMANNHLSIGGLKILATDHNANVSYGHWLYAAQNTDDDNITSDIKYSSFFPRDWDDDVVVKHLEKIINGIRCGGDKSVRVLSESKRASHDQSRRKAVTVLYTYDQVSECMMNDDHSGMRDGKKIIIELRCEVDSANDEIIQKILTAFPIATCYDICDFPLTKQQERLNDRLKRINFEINNMFVFSAQGEVRRKKVMYTLKDIVAEAFECMRNHSTEGVQRIDLGVCANKSHAQSRKNECHKWLVLFNERSTRVAIPIAIIVHHAQIQGNDCFYGPMIGDNAQISYSAHGVQTLRDCYIPLERFDGICTQIRQLYTEINELYKFINGLSLQNTLSNQMAQDLVKKSQKTAELLSLFETKGGAGVACTNFQDIRKQLSIVRAALKDEVYEKKSFADDKLQDTNGYNQAYAFLMRWKTDLSVVLRQIESKMYNDFGMKFILETIG